MAFVLARDMLRDRVKATESFRLGESLGSAGKAVWARQTEKAKRCSLGTFPLWFWTVGRNKIGGLEQREDFTFSAYTQTRTAVYRVRLEASEQPPKLRLAGALHLMSHGAKREETEETCCVCISSRNLFSSCAFPHRRGLRLQPGFAVSPLISISSHAAN